MRSLALLALASVALGAGCSLVVGTDTRTVRDGANDGGAGDAAGDATPREAGGGCSFSQGKACVDTAATCTKACGDTRESCREACGGGGPKGPCEAQCDAQRDACNQACQTTCASCVTAAGCATSTQCPGSH